jgi:magnesium transporter
MDRDPATAAAVLAEDLIRRYPGHAAAELEELSADEVHELFRGLDDRTSITLFEALRPDIAARLLLDLDAEPRNSLLGAAHPMRSAVFLTHLDESDRARIVAGLDQRTARELTEIMSYPPETAGAIMDPRVSHFRADSSARSALARLRDLRHLRINSLHVVDPGGTYLGSVRIQDLALADPEELLGRLVGSVRTSIQATAPMSEVVELLDVHHLPTLPVVDFDGRLVGVIRHDALLSAVEAEATSDMQAMVGASRAERALSPVPFAVRKRLPWLQINLLTAFLASFVVGLFEDTIARFTALAVLLPVVAGQSGNTGAQALAVTMRGLALREIRVRHAARIALKESIVGAVNGVAVALVTAAAVYVWSRSVGLAVVIGVAMVLSMLIAGLAGATIPMILTVAGQDPAQASSIVLTTVTDIAGFLSFLGLATLMTTML